MNIVKNGQSETLKAEVHMITKASKKLHGIAIYTESSITEGKSRVGWAEEPANMLLQ